MSDNYPRPGDTIEITWDFNGWLGKRYVVVECPESFRDTGGGDPSNAWVLVGGDERPSYFLSCNYKIVARGNGQTGKGSDVDKSLKRQLNDNLRGYSRNVDSCR